MVTNKDRDRWRKENLEDEMNRRDYEKTQLADAERREDLLNERELWGSAVLQLISDGKNVHDAIRVADFLLAEYRARFQ